MIRPVSIVSALWLLAGFSPARGDLAVALAPATQNAAAGVQSIFCGTLTNTSATESLFLNDLQVSGQAAPLVPGTNTFFANVPGILLPGQTYTGPLFATTLGGTAPPADYPATVTILGGGDILAETPLASVTFTVLSPAVNVVASTPTASEYGPVPGAFTISRSGMTSVDLSVSYTLSGTAADGTDYTAVPLTVTIPAGSPSASVAITPIPEQLTQGNRTAILTLTSSPAFNLGTAITDIVTIQDLPVNQWRLQEFGAAANTPAAADTAEWDGNGLPNLIAYALNLDPLVANASALPAPVVSGGYLTISYVPNPAAIDLQYIVEASTDLVNWSATNVESVALSDPQPPNLVTWLYREPVGIGGQAFLRLRVIRMTSP